MLQLSDVHQPCYLWGMPALQQLQNWLVLTLYGCTGGTVIVNANPLHCSKRQICQLPCSTRSLTTCGHVTMRTAGLWCSHNEQHLGSGAVPAGGVDSAVGMGLQ